MAGTPKRHEDLQALQTSDVGQRVLEMLAAGKSITQICLATGLGKRALGDWLEAPEQAEAASRARAQAATVLATEVLDIADEVDADHPGEVNKAKIRIGARQWLAERWNRGVYGAPQRGAEVTVNINAVHLDALRARTVGRSGDEAGIIDVTPLPPSQAELDAL